MGWGKGGWEVADSGEEGDGRGHSCNPNKCDITNEKQQQNENPNVAYIAIGASFRPMHFLNAVYRFIRSRVRGWRRVGGDPQCGGGVFGYPQWGPGGIESTMAVPK